MELHVVEQGIDTSTMEGRAMFGMLSVLAEPQRELVVADTNDGLAAAPGSPGGGSTRPGRRTTAAPTSPKRSHGTRGELRGFLLLQPARRRDEAQQRHHRRSQPYPTETS
ncbi:recombinase family protein [Streptosporangium sandarakinum]